MSLLFGNNPLAATSNSRQKLDVVLLHRLECKVCPLSQLSNKHPDISPSGTDRPLVYLLGTAPGKQEDAEDSHFVDDSGALLRARIPRDFKKLVRFNTVVRTRPKNNDHLGSVEIECCRPSIVRDIEATKPKAIFGFGNVPLEWVMGGNTLQDVIMWRGRRMPVRVGKHTCWYYPMLSPSYLLKQRRSDRDDPATAIGSEEERMFAFDLKRAFAEIDDLPVPKVHTAPDVWAGLDCLTGAQGLQPLEDWFAWALEQPYLGFDYETDRLRPYSPSARILTAAFATETKGFSFALEHPDAQWTSSGELDKVFGMLEEFLLQYKGVKFVHNLAFELEWTGVRLNLLKLLRTGKWEDTSVQASILDERKGTRKPGCFSLEFLVQQYFGFNLKKLSDLDKANLANEPLDIVLRYNGGDSKYHCALGLVQRARLEDEGLDDVYWDALRRVPTVVLSQIKGVPVDQAERKRLQGKYKNRIATLEQEIAALPIVKQFQKLKGWAFQPFSGPDVLYVFKDMLRRKECVVYDKKKRADRDGVDAEVLEKIDHPLAEKLLPLREANKRLSVYIDPLDPNSKKTLIYPDGNLHSTFNTIFARTGRLSSEGPNLQNFPKRDGEAKEVRKQIKAPPGCVIFTVDYGQIEARVIAMFTKDKEFCKALWEDYDVHQEWAERIARAYPRRIGGKENLEGFKLAGDPKKDPRVKAAHDFRTDIKNQWTFPLFFGASLQSAAGYLNIPIDVLEPEYNRFWRVFSGVADWQEDQWKFYCDHGYVECLTGRRRRGPMSKNMVFNSPVQGTAAEIVMDAMCRLSELEDPMYQPEINIHDDLTYCRVPENKLDEVAEKVIDLMLKVPFDFINVPIAVEAGVGPDWLNIDAAGKYYSNKWK